MFASNETSRRIQSNNFRTCLLFIIFILLMQALACVVLWFPLTYFDLNHTPFYFWGNYLTRYGVLLTLIAIGYFALNMRWHISFVQRQLKFKFVDNHDEPRLCRAVEQIANVAGIPAPFVGVIETSAMNSLACGTSPSRSMVAFTRGLIDNLDDRELASVIAHELMHIRNRDTRLLAAANIFVSGLNILNKQNLFLVRSYRPIFLMLLHPLFCFAFVFGGLFSSLLVRLGFASRFMIASSREYLADAEAVQLINNPAPLLSALRRIEGNSQFRELTPELDCMMFDGMTDGGYATHPTLAERIAVLAASTGKMALSASTDKNTRLSPHFITELAKDFSDRGLSIDQLAIAKRVSSRPNWSSLFRAGKSDVPTFLGMRWDLAIAVAATFTAALILHHRDIPEFLGKTVAFYEMPNNDTMAIVNAARNCQWAEVKYLLGQATKEDLRACDHTATSFVAAAKKFGINILPNGEIATDAQYALMSENDKAIANAPSPLGAGTFVSRADGSHMGVANTLAVTYPISLQEAYQRVMKADMSDYIEGGSCGFPVEAKAVGLSGNSVRWDFGSEGQVLIKFKLKVEQGEDAAHSSVSFTIEDNEKISTINMNRRNNDGTIVADGTIQRLERPLLEHPLRAGFTEAVAAALEQRLVSWQRINLSANYPEPKIETMCRAISNWAEVTNQKFSIFDSKPIFERQQ